MIESRFRVEIFSNDSSHGPSGRLAIIDDAKSIGVSDYVNQVGEAFFTLPDNHASISVLDPLKVHYRIARYNSSSDTFDTVGRGLIEDYDSDDNELTFYGADYKSLLETTITQNGTSYASATLGSIVTAELSTARTQSNSRIGFTSVGTIDATSKTATLISNFQPRLQFLSSVADLSMATRSVRTVLAVARDSPYSWSFLENAGADREALRFEYGGLVNAFRYSPGYRSFATRIKGIGVKREGASVLYSDQSYALESVYGRIERAQLFQDVSNQAALDDMVGRAARRAGNADRNVFIAIRAGVIRPWDGYDLADSVRVIISRGSRIAVNGLYTIWGQEWTVNPQGREDLFLSLSVKDT